MASEFKLPVKGKDEIWMVNPAGAIHLMKKRDAESRLRWSRGWRPATKDEVALYEAAKGKQEADKPLCKPYVALPTEIVLPDEPPAPSTAAPSTAAKPETRGKDK